MGALFSKKNKEVFLYSARTEQPRYRTGAGYLLCLGRYRQAGTGYRDGTFRNGDYGILQRSDFIAAQDYSQPHPYHRSVGSSCGVGNYCK